MFRFLTQSGLCRLHPTDILRRSVTGMLPKQPVGIPGRKNCRYLPKRLVWSLPSDGLRYHPVFSELQGSAASCPPPPYHVLFYGNRENSRSFCHSEIALPVTKEGSAIVPELLRQTIRRHFLHNSFTISEKRLHSLPEFGILALL